MQRRCWGAAAARVAAGGAVGCLALQPQWLQPVIYIERVQLMSCNRNLNREFLHRKRIFVALAKYTAWFSRRTRTNKKQIQIKTNEKRARERRKEGNNQSF